MDRKCSRLRYLGDRLQFAAKIRRNLKVRVKILSVYIEIIYEFNI
jgi:hypothetical protein